ncbi:hypothetical protein MSC49_40420 (plasmid) [Methylosinus sp. C49]|nr:hypothetical protein MSC49_40420 [Methylosinus sp. C49]
MKAQKNDDRDAEGIAEAATRPTMRFVELKTQDQLDFQTLHRSRDRLVGERTALINQLRAILLERGIVVPKGKRHLADYLAVLLDEGGGHTLSDRMYRLVDDARTQWRDLDQRIAAFDAELTAFAKENAGARRLATIPGVGALIPSAPLGSGWSPVRRRRAASRNRSGSVSGATDICAGNSSMARGPRCPMSPNATRRSGDG